MLRVSSVIVGILVVAFAVAPVGVAEQGGHTIEHVSVVGGWEEGCAADATLDLLIGFAKGVGHSAGVGGFPGDAHCVNVPVGAASVAVAAEDGSGHAIRIIVSQHDAERHLAGSTVCNAGAVELLPGTIDVAFTLMPYSTTTTPCPDAAPPTRGVLLVTWA